MHFTSAVFTFASLTMAARRCPSWLGYSSSSNTSSSSYTSKRAVPKREIERSKSLAQYFQQYYNFQQPSWKSSQTEIKSKNSCCRCCCMLPRISFIAFAIICYGLFSVLLLVQLQYNKSTVLYHFDFLKKWHSNDYEFETTTNYHVVNDDPTIIMSRTVKATNVSTTSNTNNIPSSSSSTMASTLVRQRREEDPPNQSSVTAAATVVAYVVVVTSCGSNDHYVPFQIVEGAAVLKHSIHQNSIRNNNNSQYDYQLYAFYHPEARACANVLQELGYTVQERNTPVAVKDIRGDFLRERIEKNGCCGERELIKLEAFTLTQHPIVVMVDLDVLVLKPLDRLFDFILDSRNRPRDDDLLFPEKPIPDRIDLLYTTDYAMVNPGRKYKPTQGGFVVLRPNMTIYNDFVEIVTEGNFQEDGGWGGFLGKFWGAMTFQGLMPYYFQALQPGRAVELNWCVWNNMCSPSRDKGVVDDKPEGECHTQQKDCEDCRNRPVEEVALTHFTVCQKPWLCHRLGKDSIQERLCRKLHHEWFRVRSEVEQSWGRSGWGTGKFDREQFFGYCSAFGVKGYQKISPPYGGPVKEIA